MSEDVPLAKRIEASAAFSTPRKRPYSIPILSALTWTKRALGLLALALGAAALLLPEGSRAEDSSHRLLATSSGGCATHRAAKHSLEGTLAFIVVCFLACCALEHWNFLVPHFLRLPISVVLFLAGMLVGVVLLRAGDGLWGKGLDTFFEGMQGASYLNPHAIFYILLPPLLYESASSMSWRVFRKVLRSSVLLALPGVVLNTLLTGCFIRAIFLVADQAASWQAALLLASILSATDPVAVVASLHDLGAPRKLATLIEGESLLNDGSAVVFFFVFLDMVARDAPDSMKHCPGMPPPGGCVVLYFLRLALGGPALGIAIGCVLFYWIGKAGMRHAAVLEIGIILVSVYGTFFLAESVHVSGVLAVVTLGVFVSAAVQNRMSYEGRHAHHVVLAQIGYHCNQVIFFAAGIISARFMWTDEGCHSLYKSWRAWGELFALYLCIHATRGIVVLVFSPMLMRLGYGITWKEGVILVYGGLRGAVGLAMGLMVEHHAFVDRNVSATVAFHVSGIVLLTLLINGTTVDGIYRRLDPYPANAFRMTYVRKVLAMIEEECRSELVDRMCEDWFFQTVDFETIVRCIPRFSHIEFNAAGMPHPDNVETVAATLHSLEEEGTKFSADLTYLVNKQARGSNARRRSSHSWEIMKDGNTEQFIDSLQRSAMLRPHVKDTMINVVTKGDQRLDFSPSSATDLMGLYISAKPLSSVHDMKKDTAFFNVSIITTRSAAPIVGLCSGKALSQDADTGMREPMGMTPYTIGLDCGNGMMRYNGPNGTGETQLAHSVREGESVCVIVARNPESKEWEVTFAWEVDGVRKVMGRTSLGISPDDLYPAVQFLPCLVAKIRQQGSAHSAHSFMSMVSRKSPDLSKAEGRKRSRRVASIASWASTGSTKLFVRVSVSFELLSASMRESMIQLFHVMFNMVVHEYKKMHEHGLLGNEALGWLTESVEAAVECTDGELNHVRAQDFRRFSVIRAHLSDRTRRRSSEVLRRTSEDHYFTVFEPAIVEYLVLEESVSSNSWLDLFPAWSVIRRFGYSRTQSRVESLWAFVEVHTKVINECPALRRYPHLLDSLCAIVEQAKRDLGILQDLKCRRFAYCRHFLALRVMLTKKLQRLKGATNQGWLSAEDCEGIEASIWDRLHQVERFIPGLRTKRLRRPNPTDVNWSLKRPRSASLDSILPFEQHAKSLEVAVSQSQSSGASLSVGSVPLPASREELLALFRTPVSAEDRAWRETFGHIMGNRKLSFGLRSRVSSSASSQSVYSRDAMAALASAEVPVQFQRTRDDRSSFASSTASEMREAICCTVPCGGLPDTEVNAPPEPPKPPAFNNRRRYSLEVPL